MSPFFKPTALPVLLIALGLTLSACDQDGVGEDDSDESTSQIRFSDLRAEELSATSATIRFTTSRETTCEVEYGTKPESLNLRATDPDMDEDNPYSIDHEVPLEDLPIESTIYFRARAETPSGQISFSEVQSFQTKSGNSDSPLNGMTNIALLSAGTSVSDVSSNFGGAQNNENWGAEAAIDGKSGSEWATAGDGSDAWLSIDLGSLQSIEALSFRSRQMSDGTSIIRSFTLTFDGKSELGPFETPDPDQTYEFLLEESFEARLIRLDVVESSDGNTGIKEFGLYSTLL